MKTHQAGKSVVIDAVPDGSCFAFRRREVTYVAIKINNERMTAILWPFHPSDQGIKCGLLGVDAMPHEVVWLLPDAIFVPHAWTGQIRTQNESWQEIGSLALTDKSVFPRGGSTKYESHASVSDLGATAERVVAERASRVELAYQVL